MFCTRTTYYALRAVAELAAEYGGGPLKASAIARAQGIPPKYLHAILNDLKRAGLVTARRGAAGGFRLAHPPNAVTPRDVIRSMQGPIAPPTDPGKRAAAAGEGDDGMFRPMWAAVQEAVDAACEAVTFAELVEEQKRRRGDASPDFVI